MQTMGLLTRLTVLALAIPVLLALNVLPATDASQGSCSWFSASTAWAGGSPDETLNPPVDPPQAKWKPGEKPEHQQPPSVESLRHGDPSFADRFARAWQFYLTTVLRF